MRKAVLFALMAVALAGCVTAAHTVDVDDIKSLRIERFDLALDPAAKVLWYNAQKEYADSRNKQGDAQATDLNVMETPGYRAYVLSRLQVRAKAVVEPTLRQTLAGSRPAIARMTIHHVQVPSLLNGLVTAVFLGAGQVQSGMTVSIDFVDARTNRVIVAYPKTGLITQGRQQLDLGFSGHFAADPIDRMFAQLQNRLPDWLLKTEPAAAVRADG